MFELGDEVRVFGRYNAVVRQVISEYGTTAYVVEYESGQRERIVPVNYSQSHSDYPMIKRGD